METQYPLAIQATLLLLVVVLIAELISQYNKKREWHEFWSYKGTFGHCGQNVKCQCTRPLKPIGPTDFSYFINRQRNETVRIVEMYREAEADNQY